MEDRGTVKDSDYFTKEYWEKVDETDRALSRFGWYLSGLGLLILLLASALCSGCYVYPEPSPPPPVVEPPDDVIEPPPPPPTEPAAELPWPSFPSGVGAFDAITPGMSEGDVTQLFDDRPPINQGAQVGRYHQLRWAVDDMRLAVVWFGQTGVAGKRLVRIE